MGIKIINYSHLNEIYQLNFITKDQIKELEIVVPNPQIADYLRQSFKPFQLDIKTITASRFVSNLLIQANCKYPVLKKSELLIHFTTIWKNKFPTKPFSLFSQAYEIFSDWRSFTLTKELLESAFLEIDEEISQAVKFFWTYMEAAELFDEHAAYEFLAQNNQLVKNKEIIFYGFPHLSNTQINFLNSISEDNSVYILVPHEVWNNRIYSDWISWLGKIESSAKREIIELNIKKINLFEKTKLNQIVKLISPKHLYLGEYQSLADCLETASENHFFKTQLDILSFEIKEFIKNLNSSKGSSIKEISYKINQDKADFAKNKKWKMLKVCELADEVFEQFKDFDYIYDDFLSELLNQVITLNAPRNFAITLDQESESITYSEDYLWAPSLKENLDIIINSNTALFKNSGIKYSSKVFAILSALGPIRRAGLKREWFLSHLKMIANRGNIFLESSLIEESSFWKEVAEKAELHKVDVNDQKNVAWEITKKTAIVEKISPTMLQSYYDCPRKYFVEHVDSINYQINNEEQLEFYSLGNLEHEIIQSYFEQFDIIEFEKVKVLAQKKINDFILKFKKKITESEKKIILDELINYASSALEIILPLKSVESRKFIFEKEFYDKKYNIGGRIDLWIQDGDQVCIIDFKRSNVPSQKEINESHKLQLWAYYISSKLNPENTCLAYLNLAKPEESISWGNNFLNFKFNSSKIDLIALSGLVDQKISSLCNDLIKEKAFAINPIKKEVCQNCVANIICPKSPKPEREKYAI